MKSDFKFSNLLGTVYRQGNLVYTEDGTKLLSPVGNRVSCFDLINNKSFTFNYEHRRNISRIALNKQGTLLLSVDETGRAILVNFVSRTVLHHFNFKDKVLDLQFSPDGHYFAIACNRFIQVWKTPDFTEDRQFAPFVRHRVYAGHYSDVTSVTWSNDSRFFISTSKDMTSRIFSLSSKEKEVAMTLAGHRDYVIKAFFNETQEIIYTISKDGALFQWEYTERPSDESDEEEEESDSDSEMNDDVVKNKKPMSWRITAKNFFHSNANVKCATFHAKSNLLIVGFTNGEFRLYDLPEFNMIQQLSMGQNAVNTVNINKTGEWLAFGSSKLGQLLVYEWQSESYILKQQGHFDSMNALCYSPDGSRIVTASDDGKIKIWDVASGFCLMTFQEHTSSVTAVQFAKKGQVLFSSSLDGTIRAWDLIRFRNFRTFTATERVQFNSLAVDPSGEVVVAGSQDTFEIYVWSVQTAQLLDSLTGHEGPISCLAFGTENSVLASASWDKTIRVWNIFSRSQQVEPIEIQSDVLSIALRPDSKEVAVTTLDGHITIWDVEDAKQVHLIDGKKDIIGGRYLEDRFSAKNSARSKYFTTLNYSFDGLSLVAAGNNNSICLYDISNEVLLKRFTVSQNMQLNGTLGMLNSSRMTEAGSLDLIDRDGENSDLEDRIDTSLPGSHKGDPSARNIRPEIRVTSISFSPTSSAFSAASTEGLLVYSVDNTLIFDPFDLDIDITPEATIETLNEKDYLTALVMAFRLNENYLIHKVYESIPIKDIKLVTNDLPIVYLDRMLQFVGKLSLNSPHLEFNLLWIQNLLTSHGKYINNNKSDFTSSLRLLQRFLARIAKDVVSISKKNGYAYSFLTTKPDIQDAEVEAEDESEEFETAQNIQIDGSDDENGIIEDEDDEGWFGIEEKNTKSDVFNSNESDSDSDSDESME
ncbi:DEHA2B05874p [Debaryomyces hansenii CBS767]|uniref:DEHA2B05874p n=1 Tax=Debaryomyces hansenii (strain ATCC 36239 / CBS 767 / BCRC 21394 / JCM 1990 / NBRC 0083 / IGC 2968) TaxID=284592 RepID=Q6BX53_DEBHA|nr:DEHA2B05874p [Debaryomyces hansenii CBS767]CAG85211.2 DEHA2B05874p [Debaryomyces hansenii CBS767]|eukprot:XP_457216.2 DEHA2B05874p [Debaryomyces hansenii CBS767]